ncbi:hypothetical protein HZY62_21520 [Maribacter polysiphoniae]|uniref:Uncharacterized protein n=1 Tax=Maribacter polysiphoniae TaxID=429344 RepID=A0A316DNW8_9FLAO|nr:hypothetical protein [Maribacter polysiphoniae]MBD1263181.1 hypothetical protein [Maribacter polysiphoniae]PWK18453.1 hypothetical protein LX92_04327 [Maribacter polysiphoniae]
MKTSFVKYVSDWKLSPMAYWVHIETDSKPWYLSQEFEPPAPKRFGTLGFPQLTVEFNGHSFIFTSKEQLEQFIEIMGRKLLPSSMELSSNRTGFRGPNSHWLSRLPGKTKPWKYREKLVGFCKKLEFPK